MRCSEVFEKVYFIRCWRVKALIERPRGQGSGI
jgi:hypothetical protein